MTIKGWYAIEPNNQSEIFFLNPGEYQNVFDKP